VLAIPGTKKILYLQENWAAQDLVLSPEELARLQEAFPLDAAAGTRYPEAMMKSVNV